MTYSQLDEYISKYSLTLQEKERLLNTSSYYPVVFDENAALEEIYDILAARELDKMGPLTLEQTKKIAEKLARKAMCLPCKQDFK